MKKLKAILLIDDDSIFAWLTITLLEDMQVVERIDHFNDPEIALDYLTKLASSKERMEEHCPDIIFLDIKMPVLNGFDILERLQQIEGCQDVKKRIIVLSSSVLEADMYKALSYHVHSYETKPLTETTIRKIIQSFQDETLETSEGLI